jgi:DNA-binding Lrp family transcriptional regulator
MKNMKNTELRLIAELMKNSRRSDRELAKVLRVSQPTVTRVRTRLEKEGVIQEYTMIPDFGKLGYQIMGITSLQLTPKADYVEIRKRTIEYQKNNPTAMLTGVKGLGGDKNRLFINFYENYSAYCEIIRKTREFPSINVDSVSSFLVDLTDKTHLRILSMSDMANDLLMKSANKDEKANHSS